MEWIEKNYPIPAPKDPIPSWKKRLKSLQQEKSSAVALMKYCDFGRQTEEIRNAIEMNAALLDEYIQSLIDHARWK